MKRIVFIFLLIFPQLGIFAQEVNLRLQQNQKGRLYIYWGWNRAWYTNSNITFKGDNYNFTLKDVFAKDRQSKFKPALYWNPATITIPQYNFRIGYFINSKYNISFGVDHMKYVMQQNQKVTIEGDINLKDSPYNNSYSNQNETLTEDFLKFEHTDGLNYIHVALRRQDSFLKLKRLELSSVIGIESGILLPKTNTTLLGMERYDEFHLSGYGFSSVFALNISPWKGFFLQPELKGGILNLPDIRTTKSTSDKANQHFGFLQFNIVFGASIQLSKKQRTNSSL
jgi:hypothetical protein